MLTHRSNPLPRTLERFNAWSNNDIERLADALGHASELERFLAERWGGEAAGIRLASLSGLGTNRMTTRQVVRLLDDLAATAERHELSMHDLMPVAGCDPGTLKSFPALLRKHPGAVVAKTGTLVSTDGGVAVLAGFAETAKGRLTFCVVAPEAGRDIPAARAAQESWLLDQLAARGGTRASPCGPPPSFSDADARLLRGEPDRR